MSISISRPTSIPSSNWTSQPRAFPTTGFELLDNSSKIEEETLPTYSAENYYPVRQGEILNERYQTIAKLGYGVTSTVSLARDLAKSTHVVLKIYVRGQNRDHELNTYNHLNSFETDHPGKEFIRKLLAHFYVDGPHGRHVCLVHEPLGLNVTDLLRLTPGRTMSVKNMKPAIRKLLGTLDFLHSVAGVIHTDVQLRNLLLPAPSPAALSAFEERELNTPSARKVLTDRIIYTTILFPAGDGLPRLSDFGEARYGDEYHDESIMPDYYRAPGVILKSSWDYKVDVWSVGMVAWDIVSPRTLIQGSTIDGIFDDGAHIAELVALLGPPPPEFVKRTPLARVFWDEQGNWKNLVPIPDRSLEKLAEGIQGEDVEGFLGWLRMALRWNPEDRPTATDLLMDPWLLRGLNIKI
ncbi:U4/U6 small nuclear ribonucleo protein PRP4 [Aspergillus heteromorphus CBS 117.55]|uniref:non-specific serine/threonine protein kinase n=1 Tax=Aspergillus heteromorphus CBS 117.55 TaxID=1448321 RepID=A0A317VZL3_9EURO|nr:U4/U6 small nuclear ribonucleo protein PRP4 [Aspergillus heteromorphus CBS 117.55]PWY78378.1 U4/U6 small nuclear ribonucleo protein PRP4 [Aspergillus heteromorphus CBS 117.55]